MGKSSSGVHGNFNGRVGNVVARSINGMTVLSAYNPNVSNPKTLLQQNNRYRLTALTKFLKRYSGLLKYNFHYIGTKPTKNYFSSAVGYNAKINGIYIDGKIEYKLIMMSVGNVQQLDKLSVFLDDGWLAFIWDSETGSPSDEISIAIYNPLDDKYGYYYNAALRRDNRFQLDVSEIADNDAFVWVSVRDSKGLCSNSQCFIFER